ncbi:hypothetical protein HR45_00140 [Shewanella mangrovi]|uniref:MnmC-like methyltransferase domain-containing protein n=1 Tax=Shewanella mangrovi TaxID=1515746 RepID=A0A094LUJ4_9GAMM|nr:tRNA (5-methylaminomethyl-2-thiouridine)(34)-methyltransferase MnmD [Shewanella mangrovi]KFZ38853.1 hypothetical protein HR45_00140 [Shewanella mangrovi]
MDQVSLQLTEDGSHTLYNAELDETYHSNRGALAEARYVFIESGFAVVLPHITQQLNILEVGFGAGLNALMTLGYLDELTAQRAGDIPQVHYVSLEPFPITAQLAQQLNYPALLPTRYFSLFDAIHQAAWNTQVRLSQQFAIEKRVVALEQFEGCPASFDLIYFDAFAPSKQPDVWSLANFQKCFALLKPDGMLVSYCANGQFKRHLKAAGFSVRAHPGALGKREMTRAWK